MIVSTRAVNNIISFCYLLEQIMEFWLCHNKYGEKKTFFVVAFINIE